MRFEGLEKQQPKSLSTKKNNNYRQASRDKLENYAYDSNLLLNQAIPISLAPQLQQSLGNQTMQRLIRSGKIQTKLKVSEPEDVYEKEADRVAEHIMRMSNTPDEPYSSIGSEGKKINRKCESCEKDEESNKIKRSRKEKNPTNQVNVTDKTTRNINNIVNQTGSSLDSSTREFMQSRFGYDFGNVRIHTGESADTAAISVNALAYTLGNDIIFGKGYYQPNTFVGRSLLAHELTHVVQQSENFNLLGTLNNLKIQANRDQLVQRRPNKLINSFQFLGNAVGGGISPRLRDQLIAVEKHLRTQYDSLGADHPDRVQPGGDPVSFTDWAGVNSVRSWRPGSGTSMHQSGSAVDVNYDLQPYIVTRSVTVNKKGKNVTHYGGEGSGRSSPGAEEGCY